MQSRDSTPTDPLFNIQGDPTLSQAGQFKLQDWTSRRSPILFYKLHLNKFIRLHLILHFLDLPEQSPFHFSNLLLSEDLALSLTLVSFSNW